MKKTFKLAVMSFDGDIKIESPVFESIEDAWDYAGDLGSKWFFYPFHFVLTATCRTVVDSFQFLEWANGRRLKTIQKFFNETSALPEAVGMECDQFVSLLCDRYESIA